MTTQTHNIEFSGTHTMFKGEIDMLKHLARKFMGSITKKSEYNRLKVSIKPHGNTVNTTQRKFSLNLLLSRGNRVVHVSKEISPGTSDEQYNDRVNTANWKLEKTLQSAFSALESRIQSNYKG